MSYTTLIVDYLAIFFFYTYGDHPDLHSFPHDALPISLVLFLVLWLKLVKDFLKVRCRLALLPFLISCLIWLDLVARSPLQIGRAVQQECRDRSRMPSSA